MGGAARLAYPCVVAGGPDACTIHYLRADKALRGDQVGLARDAVDDPPPAACAQALLMTPTLPYPTPPLIPFCWSTAQGRTGHEEEEGAKTAWQSSDNMKPGRLCCVLFPHPRPPWPLAPDPNLLLLLLNFHEP